MTRQSSKSGGGGGAASAEAQPENEQIAVRRAKLETWRGRGQAYPNDYRPDAGCGELAREFAELDAEGVESKSGRYRLAGRVLAVRGFGKTTFLKIQDSSGALQLYAAKAELGEDVYSVVRKLDAGDIVGAEGSLFRTRTGELTLRCEQFRPLVKAIRPLPEKWHGLTDKETRYRQRYVDLIVNQEVRDTFRSRAQVVAGMRRFLGERGYLEVETPMMQPLAGGAAAKPFVTHHNALSMDCYLRVAPELYLKRLIVGGFERVFELNRNFRNEGISRQHNPEFTMCEFYQAYARYEDLMELTEEMLAELAREVTGNTRVRSGEVEIEFAPPYRRMTMAEAVAEHSSLSPEEALDPGRLVSLAGELGLETEAEGLALLPEIFEHVAEEHLVQPTFITGFPVEVSPLARRNDEDPRFVDRFELMIGGHEIANGFSELNDPEDQRGRFLEQVRRRQEGDEEAHMLDEDYVQALEYGMPPTAGEGIGVDRLVMLLTDSPSIRDVILFPHLRPAGGR